MAHPEWDVESLFSEQETLASPLSPEQQEQIGPMSAGEIEEAVNIMKQLGFAVQDVG